MLMVLTNKLFFVFLFCLPKTTQQEPPNSLMIRNPNHRNLRRKKTVVRKFWKYCILLMRHQTQQNWYLNFATRFFLTAVYSLLKK